MPLTPALPPQAGRGSNPTKAPSPRVRGEGGTRALERSEIARRRMRGFSELARDRSLKCRIATDRVAHRADLILRRMGDGVTDLVAEITLDRKHDVEFFDALLQR